MNGQLSEHPLAELIREILSKSLSGRLRVEHERVKVVAYFESGACLYATTNLRTLRLREYLKKGELISDHDLAQFDERMSDIELLKAVTAQKLLSQDTAAQVQTRQVTDVLRPALLWTEGSWDFEWRSRLNEQLNLKIELKSLLLEAARRLAAIMASRFRNPAEVITPVDDALSQSNLLPAEGYLLSRLEKPMTVQELAAVSGIGEEETLGLVYSLALGGLVKREHWKSAFRDQRPEPPSPPIELTPVAPPSREREPAEDSDEHSVENFLARVKQARTHYEVLDVGREVSPSELKTVYYQLARRFHPDRFRKAEGALVKQLESAFARIRQAYDTLRDNTLRASYNLKLEARKKVETRVDAAPKPVEPTATPEPAAGGGAEPVLGALERAEIQFKEGLEALELGQPKAALGLFASAANAVPTEPRYRAFYGQMLAANEKTRRAAEAELLAALKLDPGNAEYRVMLAELYRDLGLKLRAKGEAERAVAADPNNRKARQLLRALT